MDIECMFVNSVGHLYKIGHGASEDPRASRNLHVVGAVA